MGGLGLVPARTMRATAADCLLPLSSQAIRKHLRDRGVGAGVAPEFLAKRNSQLVGIRDGAPTTPSVSGLANTTSLVKSVATPAFVLARVCPVDGAASLLLSPRAAVVEALVDMRIVALLRAMSGSRVDTRVAATERHSSPRGGLA
jgi:hypothetical protein